MVRGWTQSMTPFSGEKKFRRFLRVPFGCTSEWKIDCTVTSCSADLELTNPEIYQKYCSAGDMCPTRYTNILNYLRNANDGESGIHSGRSRRSTDDSTTPAEAHVDTAMVHPCFHVNIHSPQYCIDLNDPASCWTIDLCADQFDDFNPNSINAAPQHPEPPVINEDPYELRVSFGVFKTNVLLQKSLQSQLLRNLSMNHRL